MLLRSTETEYDYMGFNEKGHGIRINGSGHGVSPMQSLLLAAAACSCVDVESLLKKMRNELVRLEVEIDGDRPEGVVPRPFVGIHLHYKLYGKIKEKSASKAIAMAIEKYCSVSSSLDPKIKITHEFTIYEE